MGSNALIYEYEYEYCSMTDWLIDWILTHAVVSWCQNPARGHKVEKHHPEGNQPNIHWTYCTLHVDVDTISLLIY